MSYLTRLFSRLSIIAAVALSTAGCVTEDFPDTPAADTTATLRIRVGTAGIAPGSRDYQVDPDAEPYELMHTLRIVIVRADGTVEHNRRIDFNEPNGTNISGYENFIVEGNEKKTVYTFANEESLPGNPDVDHTSLEYVIRSLQIGQKLPAGFDKLELSWGNTQTDAEGESTSSPQITVNAQAPVFMSRRIEILDEELSTAGDNADHAMITVSKNIVILRAAVKLTYTVTNSSSKAISLNQILFKGLTGIEYLIPNNTTLSSETLPANATSDDRHVIAYSTPYGLDKGEALLRSTPLSIPVKSSETFVYYVNEAPVWNSQDAYSENEIFEVPDDQVGDSPYSTNLLINELEFEGAFNNLPALPRNTHVKINITVGDATINCQVDVVPYIGIDLRPWFGILPDPNEEQ